MKQTEVQWYGLGVAWPAWVDFLQSRNQKGYLSFIDINTSDFYLDLKYGITYKQAMERIHAFKSDGSLKSQRLSGNSLVSFWWASETLEFEASGIFLVSLPA